MKQLIEYCEKIYFENEVNNSKNHLEINQNSKIKQIDLVHIFKYPMIVEYVRSVFMNFCLLNIYFD